MTLLSHILRCLVCTFKWTATYAKQETVRCPECNSNRSEVFDSEDDGVGSIEDHH